MSTPTVGSEILNEIERVSAKRERWKGYAADARLKGGNFAPAILMMTIAIDRGKDAVQSNDPAAAIAALGDLRGFDSQG